MNTFFQWIYRWFSLQKQPVVSEPIHFSEKTPVAPIDNTHQEIELTCHQIEQSIESIRSNIRADKDNTGIQILRCKQLIAQLDNAMQAQQSLNTE